MGRIEYLGDYLADRAKADLDDDWLAQQEMNDSAWADACAITDDRQQLTDFLRDRGDYLGLADADVIRIGGPKFCMYDAGLIAACLPHEGRECIAGDIREELRRRIAADLVSRVAA